jgi:hypothetical protein
VYAIKRCAQLPQAKADCDEKSIAATARMKILFLIDCALDYFVHKISFFMRQKQKIDTTSGQNNFLFSIKALYLHRY